MVERLPEPNWVVRFAGLVALASVLGCSSRSSKEFAAGGTSGMSSGGQSSGGQSSGGGSAGGGSPGGGPGSPGFPNAPILDDFNRNDGALGENWVGSTTFSIVDQQLSCDDCLSATGWYEAFGDRQEVYATLTAFAPTAEEINLVLRMQDLTASCDLIELIYDPAAEQARVEYCSGLQWNSLGNMHVIIQPGDQFGGRIHDDGTVEVYVNGERIISVPVAYPFSTGRIGVNGVASGTPDVWDDFGGGDWVP